ncbi:C-type mannose receptor 2-like isoform X2 [Oculina patagonica]
MKRISFAAVTVLLVLRFSLEIQAFGNAGESIHHFVFGGSNYTFHVATLSMRKRNWKESRRACKNTGSDLVSIESLKEWRFLNDTIQKINTAEYFIGLRKDSGSGEWRWISDNSTVSASKGTFPWAIREPNGDGHCVVIYKDYLKDFGMYNDLNCTTERRHGFICESPNENNCNNKEDLAPTCKCVRYSIHYYHLTWNSSRKWCQEEGGDLVSIETDQEWNYLTGFIQNLAGSKHAEYYIGPFGNKTSRLHWPSDSRNVPDRGWRWYTDAAGHSNCTVMYKYDQEKKEHFNDLPCSCRGKEGKSGLSCSSGVTDEINRGVICEKTAVDGAVASPSRKERQSKDSSMFTLVIAIGSLDLVLLVVTVLLCRGIRHHQPAERNPVLDGKKAKD